jgi:hypothetical protein
LLRILLSALDELSIVVIVVVVVVGASVVVVIVTRVSVLLITVSVEVSFKIILSSLKINKRNNSNLRVL